MDIERENVNQLGRMRKNLKILRETRNWSVKELSELSGISVKILSDIENGKDFGVNYLLRLCGIYNIKTYKIFLPIEDILP